MWDVQRTRVKERPIRRTSEGAKVTALLFDRAIQ